MTGRKNGEKEKDQQKFEEWMERLHRVIKIGTCISSVNWRQMAGEVMRNRNRNEVIIFFFLYFLPYT